MGLDSAKQVKDVLEQCGAIHDAGVDTLTGNVVVFDLYVAICSLGMIPFKSVTGMLSHLMHVLRNRRWDNIKTHVFVVDRPELVPAIKEHARRKRAASRSAPVPGSGFDLIRTRGMTTITHRATAMLLQQTWDGMHALVQHNDAFCWADSGGAPEWAMDEIPMPCCGEADTLSPWIVRYLARKYHRVHPTAPCRVWLCTTDTDSIPITTLVAKPMLDWCTVLVMLRSPSSEAVPKRTMQVFDATKMVRGAATISRAICFAMALCGNDFHPGIPKIGSGKIVELAMCPEARSTMLLVEGMLRHEMHFATLHKLAAAFRTILHIPGHRVQASVREFTNTDAWLRPVTRAMWVYTYWRYLNVLPEWDVELGWDRDTHMPL